jgi:hypothetical protein
LIGRHAVAPLRPRPFGPPLRGRATLRNGMTTGGPERLPGHETERVGFHLRNAARWSKIGVGAEAHRHGLLSYFDHRISTGPLEGVNNKIKVLKRQAYGFRDIEYFKLRLAFLHESTPAFAG